jgi:IPT/TIG domain
MTAQFPLVKLCPVRLTFAVVVVLAALFLLVPLARAGGPKYVAGVGAFDPSLKGVPLTWRQGNILYFTDPGDLSPILPHAAADGLLADAFSQWTSIPTAAISATLAGQLSEDVNGTNVSAGSGGIVMPTDIQPSAIDKPVAVVYDSDGAVIDALLGTGAGSTWACFDNAVVSAIDNFSSDAHLTHAVVIINGNCVQSASQIPDVEYRLVRALGRLLGLDWAQLNLNVITGKPRPTAQDYSGFPMMHESDPHACVPVSLCYPNAYLPEMDDRAAIGRLYPLTPQNQGAFAGKQIFAATTARVHGQVTFPSRNGQLPQGMQGVNVVARWMDPATGQPSRQYAASSVSGFLFRGNAGNTITGYDDATRRRWDRFGSDDPAVEGFFDLAGLELPNGVSSAQYEISVEAVDMQWSMDLGPYGPYQVRPSGQVQSQVVTVTQGSDTQVDLVMTGAASQPQDWYEPNSFIAPVPPPAGGEWVASLSAYGDDDYYVIPGQANRTLSIEVTTLDESGAPTIDKAQPVIGMWSMASPPGTVPGAATTSLFNTTTFATARLDAVLLASTNFRIGVADFRGDGRPDYFYRARVFYGDHVAPARVGASGGGLLTISGLGFRPGMTVLLGNKTASVLSVNGTRALVSAPAMPDGLQSIQLLDSTSGASSKMTDVIMFGASPTDSLVMLTRSNPPTVAGGEATNPIRVRVLAADGVTPVAGASVNWSISPVAALSACGGASSCTISSDDNGEALTRVTPPVSGTYTITATLAPASYTNPKFVKTTLSSVSSALDIALQAPYRRLAQGASLDLPITTRVLSNGAPIAGRKVDFQVMAGSAGLTSAVVSTDANGYATTTLQVKAITSDVQVSACVAPANAPCATLYVFAAALNTLQLQTVSGSTQTVGPGQAFQPLTLRVTDSSSPPNPVQGATVSFLTFICRPQAGGFYEGGGDSGTPVILSLDQELVTSDAAGIATIVPSAGGIGGEVELDVMAMAGTMGLRQFVFHVEMVGLGPGGASPGGVLFWGAGPEGVNDPPSPGCSGGEPECSDGGWQIRPGSPRSAAVQQRIVRP